MRLPVSWHQSRLLQKCTLVSGLATLRSEIARPLFPIFPKCKLGDEITEHNLHNCIGRGLTSSIQLKQLGKLRDCSKKEAVCALQAKLKMAIRLYRLLLLILLGITCVLARGGGRSSGGYSSSSSSYYHGR